MKHFFLQYLLIVTISFLMFAISDNISIASASNDKTESKVDEIMSKMTTQEKIGQLFMVRPESLCSACLNDNDNKVFTALKKYPAMSLPDELNEDYLLTAHEEIIASLENYPVGGLIFFQNHLASAKQVKEMLAAYQANSKISLFMGVDEEGGRVARIGKAALTAPKGSFNVPIIPYMADIGATNDPNQAKLMGETIGSYLSPLGFNLDLAPVADINTNPNNIVIGRRAFGSTPKIVTEMVRAELKGLHSASIMGCTKHYPGHGDTCGDTHMGKVIQEKSWKELLAEEIVPFKETMNDTDMIMVSHITAINVDPSNLPSTLSKVMITDKLRNELGYQGVVITDAMDMEAIYGNDDNGEASVQSFLAGADIILMPANIKKAYQKFMLAVLSGKITEKRLDESLRRILMLKAKYGLIQ